MNTLIMQKKQLTPVLIFLSLLMLSSWCSASVPLGAPRKASSGKKDMFGCIQTNEYYIANFAAYQVDPAKLKETRRPPEPECVDLPRTGVTQISVDMLDRDVRRKQVALKVLRADGQVIVETPLTLAKQGVLSAQADFKAPGHYEVVVSVVDDDLHVAPEVSALHIPLSVGLAIDQPAPKGAMATFFIAAAIGILGLGWGLPRLLRTQPAA
jgi:hypothetical protein